MFPPSLPLAPSLLCVETVGIPGDPPNTVNGGTTVSGGRTVLSNILQQSFSIHDRDLSKMREGGGGRRREMRERMKERKEGRGKGERRERGGK